MVRVRARRVRGRLGDRCRVPRADELGIGDSHGAEKVLAREFPTERGVEEVLIQSRGRRLGRADLRAATDDLVARLSRAPAVAAIESPLEPGNGGQLSRDGRSALVTFRITGDPDTAPDRVGPALAATAAVQRAHPGLLIGRRWRRQCHQGDQRSHRR
jgi:RND superfamily putative drug exporter